MSDLTSTKLVDRRIDLVQVNICISSSFFSFSSPSLPPSLPLSLPPSLSPSLPPSQVLGDLGCHGDPSIIKCLSACVSYCNVM